ncbi:MAG: flagellar basal body-associated FliL family protein [Nitrospirae bacterium]|nr:flagellar basal body-associated FliL family protein [Nitrospirota bacterium]
MIKQRCRAIFLVILAAFFLMPGLISCSKSDGNQGTEKGDKQKAEETVNFALDAFIVNLNTPKGTSFLKASLQLELASAALAERAKTKTPHLRDAIVTVLSNKTPEELMTVEGKQQCKDEIALIVNQILGEGSVKNVYFTDFVMQ